MAAIEFARNVCGVENATTEEIIDELENSLDYNNENENKFKKEDFVIHIIKSQKNVDKGFFFFFFLF
jgi:CTP synthase (UTP-ammonia lyase)